MSKIYTRIFTKSFSNNLWHFELGSKSNSKKFSDLVYDSVIQSYISVPGTSPRVSESLPRKDSSNTVPDLLTTALLIPTLLRFDDQFRTSSIIDQFILSITPRLHSVERHGACSLTAVLHAITALREADHDAVEQELINQFCVALINNRKNLTDSDHARHSMKHCSRQSAAGYSIAYAAVALGNKSYTDIGLSLVHECTKSDVFDRLLDDVAPNPGDGENTVDLRSLIILLESLLNTSILFSDRKLSEFIMDHILALHRKFEISRALFKKEYTFGYKPVTKSIDMVSNPHIASLWFMVGVEQNDNLLLNSAFKMMDLLRGIILSNCANNAKSAARFELASTLPSIIHNNLSSKYFIEASLKEIQARQGLR